MPFPSRDHPRRAARIPRVAVDKMTCNSSSTRKWPRSALAFPAKLDIELAWVPGGLVASTASAATTDALVDRALDGTATPGAALPAWQALHRT